MKLKVKSYAKKSAKEGLELRNSLPKYKRFGLSEKEARKLGIFSGVFRAKQLIGKDYYDWDDYSDKQDLISMYRFYQRFKNCRTFKCEGSMLLWGGRTWLYNDVVPFVKSMR